LRILITGTSGQLGAALAAALTLHTEIIGIDRVEGTSTTHAGNLEDTDFVRRAAEGVDAIIHIASLHARHIHTHTKREFIATNVLGTQSLLDAAIENQVKRFVYTSTTSVYGDALIPKDRAVWVTEGLTPNPRDIYDVTKLAAEQLCALAAREHSLKVICLRTGRFFHEPPDLTAIYRLYRGVDVRDVVSAHLLALENSAIDYGIYNIAAHTPFIESDTPELWGHADRVITRYFPSAPETFASRSWSLPTHIDRVYVTDRAARELGYQPRYNFESLLSPHRT
jgi:UDP-glucose 4-epimerase